MSPEMQRRFFLKGNENGFVLITSILVLIVLTLVGTAMYNTTLFETIIAGNDMKSQEQFFMADGGLNAVLAEHPDPPDLPTNYANPGNKYSNCDNPNLAPMFTSFDLDSDNTDDVMIYLLENSNSNPPEIRVAACARRGTTIGEIIAGIQYGTPTGAPGSTGDILEY